VESLKNIARELFDESHYSVGLNRERGLNRALFPKPSPLTNQRRLILNMQIIMLHTLNSGAVSTCCNRQ